MPLHSEALDQSTVLHALEDTVHVLEHDAGVRDDACSELGIGTPEWDACRDELIEELQEAEEWGEREEDPDFLPSNATLALFQSAMNEHLDNTARDGFQPDDVKWLSVLYQRLRLQVRGKAPFISHTSVEDFRFPLSERSTVAIVGDWGTGNPHAAAVAAQIRHRDPDHVVHLGDVYFAGSRREMRVNFLDMWRSFGPTRARYWGLNGNHDMYGGGHGYFRSVLPAFNQPASYFNLGNQFWRVLALDSAYVNHTFTKPQMAWFDAQFDSPARTVLLTHHHLMSPFRRRGDRMEEWLDPFLRDGRLYAWLWGHDHYLIQYADYRGVKCRCVGHGSVPASPPDRRRHTHAVDIVRMETRSAPENPARGMHGFAMMTFDGPALQIEYVDEQGGTAWTETWQ